MSRAARSARGFGLGSLVAHHARVRGLAPAVADTEARLDFATLNRRVNRVANGLVAAGVRHGDRVAVRLPNGHRYLECLFGCAKIGAVLVPIDQALVQDEVDHVVSDSAAAVLLDGPSDFDELAEPAGAEEPDAPAGLDDDPLLLMYTSGNDRAAKGGRAHAPQRPVLVAEPAARLAPVELGLRLRRGALPPRGWSHRDGPALPARRRRGLHRRP